MTREQARSSTTVRYSVPSETSCPSGWAETSAKSDGVGVITDSWYWLQTVPFEILPVEIDKLVDVKAVKPASAPDELAKLLADITAADAAGDLKRAYRSAFRALDEHMLEGRWEQLDQLLIVLLSKQYSTDVGVGALRFCSSAKQRISGWPILLKAAKQRCSEDGSDYRVVLRGLV